MNKEDGAKNDDKISLDLTLGLHPHRQEEEDPVDQQGSFMQLFQSVSHPLPYIQQYHNPPPTMLPPRDYIFPWNGGVAPPFGVVSSSYTQVSQPPQAYIQVSQPPQAQEEPPRAVTTRARRSNAAATVDGNVGGKEIVPPYPWATRRPAILHTLAYLLSMNVTMISGQVHCKPCQNTQTLEYNLQEKFAELRQYINDNKEVLRHRAPDMWRAPELTPCGSCETGMKPVISENKEEINWLFLLLGNMLGCCTLEQLRYFCDKTQQHRTGAKDRILYITYMGLCKQLDPDGPFDL